MKTIMLLIGQASYLETKCEYLQMMQMMQMMCGIKAITSARLLPKFAALIQLLAETRTHYPQLLLPAPQAGCSEIVGRVTEDLKDASEPYRRMVMETIDKVVAALGTADIDARLEESLIDGILYAFQEQVGFFGFWFPVHDGFDRVAPGCSAPLALGVPVWEKVASWLRLSFGTSLGHQSE